MNWLRRIRGVIGMGLTWAVAWSFVGAVQGVADFFLVFGQPPGIPLGLIVATYARMFAGLGFFGGAIFSTVLGITEGRRRFDELSPRRFAAWGALGGLLLGVLAASRGAVPWALGPGIGLLDVVIVGVATLLGAGSAAGSLAVAKGADDRELLEHGADVADIGLTEEEKRELLTE